jgi:hypothetical protein
MPKWDLKAVLGGMAVGDSFFVPCLECKDLNREINSLAKMFDIEVEIKYRTEELIKGLRTWRVR